MIKNDLFLRVLNGEATSRPPVWMMRQAGRYLPEYIKIREKYDFFTRCQTPELASEITIQPIRRYGMDAAILFSDILVIPQAMNIEVQMVPNVGPVIPNPVRSLKDLDQVIIPEVNESLGYVFDAIKMTKEKLEGQVPLIGFAGSPWTLLCYIVQGRGSKVFELAKQFCFNEPEAAHLLLDKLTETTIEYLKGKIKAGADVIQLFDSWGGILSPEDYLKYSWPYLNRIIDALEDQVPVIMYGKGCWFAMNEFNKSKASAIGIDWTCAPKTARSLVDSKRVLQGNLDPSYLLSNPTLITNKVNQMIGEFGHQHYIVNLGHGITPKTPLDNVKAFFDTVKNYQALEV